MNGGKNSQMKQWIMPFMMMVALAVTACRPAPEEISKEVEVKEEVGGICGSVSEIPVAECQALVAFYHRTGGPDWALKRGWLETEQPCQWAGIRCEAGHVTAITLNYNDLRGELPAEMGLLSELKMVSLYFNYLTGPIPPEVGQLSKLETLILHNNRLEGTLPPELGHLSQLKELDLESNRLSGPIPAALGQLAKLEKLNLNSNDLSSAIPPELGNLTNLRGLFLAGNHLSGDIPAELGNLAKLWMFNVNGNNLSGSVPAKLQALPGSGYDFFEWGKGQSSAQTTE
jgi:Leucine-rich repeat (LRR) protein